MLEPGARSSTSGLEFENDDIASVLVVEPTVIADEMQAGKLTPSANPLLPEAIAVAMPTERRLSMIGLRESVSQLTVDLLPPRLMFTDAMRSVVPQREHALEALDLVAGEAQRAGVLARADAVARR